MSSQETPTLPPSCVMAYKEWAGVCAALGSGEQTILIRKGGIAEGPGGFAPEHPVFWLYPTSLHQGQQGLKVDRPIPPPPPGEVEIRFLARFESVRFLDRADLLPALDPFHAWTEATVRQRFDYRQPGLWVMAVRLFRAEKPLVIAVTAEHSGCKTWVVLDEALACADLQPVLSDEAARSRRDALELALSEAQR